MLPHLDFSTIKNDLFPVIAIIFSRTSSLAIKVRGLQAFVTLCGGSNDPGGEDGLDGLAPQKKKATSSTALDKFTMQEKIVPLIKAIKTKEPAVMIAALNVLRVVGNVADSDFVAMDILPILWTMSLGPLLDLKQFRAFMELIKSLSSRVEDEQIKKLQELAGGASSSPAIKDDIMSFGPVVGSSFDANGTTENDFESLVKGGAGSTSANPMDSGWDTMASASATITSSSTSRKSTPTATFSWSSPPAAAPSTAPTNQFGAVKAQQPGFRTVTPDLAAFQPITPTTTQFSQPLQPASKPNTASSPLPTAQPTTSINWGAAAAATTSSSNIWASPSTTTTQPPTSSFGSLSLGQQQLPQTSAANPLSRGSSFSLPPPPSTGTTATPSSGLSGFSLAPPPGGAAAQRPQMGTSNSTGNMGGMGMGGMSGMSSMGSMGSMNSMNTLASMAATNKAATSAASGMGMGMGMAAMKSMNSGGNGMSMNSMMGMGGMGSLGGMGGIGGQQPGQSQAQGQGQGQKSGLDKYESLL